MPRVVYSPAYNIGFFGLERLHPFDSRKYGRAWRRLRQQVGPALRQITVRPLRPVDRQELLIVHTPHYLERLRDAKYLASALEIPAIRYLPLWLIDWCVLLPMRWATMGTVVAAREALQCGFAINLGGGFHHAKQDAGEGFCIYSDIGLVVRLLRRDRAIDEAARIAYIDLDAHQGNGVCHAFMSDRQVFIFDMYNGTIYPSYDKKARERIDCDIRLTSTCSEDEYLRALRAQLPSFLDSITMSQPVRMAIYNAGTDVLSGDPLGGLSVSAAGIIARDEFVVRELRNRGIPVVMLLSGGYTRDSYMLIADSAVRLLEVLDSSEDFPCPT